jgi:hypothetical protein
MHRKKHNNKNKKFAVSPIKPPSAVIATSGGNNRRTDAEEIAAIETQPSVQLIVSDGSDIVGGWGGESRTLAGLIETLAAIGDIPIYKTRSDFLSAGQSCYTTTGDILASMRSVLFFIPWNTWDTMERFNAIVPSQATITFVVSY